MLEKVSGWIKSLTGWLP